MIIAKFPTLSWKNEIYIFSTHDDAGTRHVQLIPVELFQISVGACEELLTHLELCS